MNEAFDLTAVEPDPEGIEAGAEAVFAGRCFAGGPDRSFGGHIAAQALLAASGTVAPDRPVHSLHAYFLSMGRPAEDVRYRVRSMRDGGSFSLREAVARQSGGDLLALTASFKRPEAGPERHVVMPPVPDPDELGGPETDSFFRLLAPDSEIAKVVDVRTIDGADAPPGGARHRMWIRFTGPLPAEPGQPAEPALHAAALTFLSDLSLASTAARGYLRALGEGPRPLFLASLDHAMWFHHRFRADEWLLYTKTSRVSGDGRGLSAGEFWTRDGVLVASATQEALIREPARGRG